MVFTQIESTPRSANSPADLMAGAGSIAEILERVQAYLDSWSRERIIRLQKMDGGWAPFDRSQRPLRVGSLGKVHASGDAIHLHCVALRAAGFPLTPELVELDEFFRAARQLIRAREQAGPRTRTPETRTPSMQSRQEAMAI